jgi:molybdopterin-guanine dinucleotide biosynthesis protein A
MEFFINKAFMKKQTGVTGIIMAGGKSSRMGFDKGLAEIQGKKMITWVIQALEPICNDLIIISNTDIYQNLGIAIYQDTYKEIGPLGGIYSGLSYTSTNDNLVVACDMPFVTSALFNHLLQIAPGYDIVMPVVQGQWQPLCAYYNKQIKENLEELIKQKTWKMQEVIGHFHYKEWIAEQTGFNASMFANINTRKELEQVQNKLE